MASLVWLGIPLIFLIGAMVWGSFAGRRRPTADGSSLAGYERFQEAMRRSHSG